MKVLLFWFNGMSLDCSVGGILGKSRCLVSDPSEFSVMLRNLYGSFEGGGASMDASEIGRELDMFFVFWCGENV